MKRLEFEQLVQKVVEKSATAEEFGLVQEELRDSSEFRRIFRESFLVDEFLIREMEAGCDLKPLIPMEAMMIRQRRRALWSAGLAAAAVLLLVGVVMRLVMSEPDRMVSVRAAPNSQWSLVKKDAASGKEIQPGDALRIESGTLELSFSKGVHGIISGPAQLVFKSSSELTMSHGSGRFLVSPEAVGFKVSSPRVEVVDLGTSFGVHFPRDPARNCEVHVFEGRVSVSARSGVKEKRELGAGEAVGISFIGRLQATELDASGFYTALPDDLPYMRFTMEALDGGGLEVRGNHPAIGSTRSWTKGGVGFEDGRAGRAVSPGKNGRVMTNWEGILGDRPRTICAWIRCAPDHPWQQYQSIAGWGVPTIGFAGKSELLVIRDKPGAPARLRLSFDQFLFTGTTDLADGRWHHVAGVFEGQGGSAGGSGEADMVRLYVDGFREAFHPTLTSTTTSPRMPSTRAGGAPLMIGYVPAHPRSIAKAFQGAIDEVMVFDAALSEARIREIAKGPR